MISFDESEYIGRGFFDNVSRPTFVIDVKSIGTAFYDMVEVRYLNHLGLVKIFTMYTKDFKKYEFF